MLAPKPITLVAGIVVAGGPAAQPFGLVGGLPAATLTVAGGVTRGVAVANLGAATAAPSVAAPTKAEFDAVVADLAATRSALSALLVSLRAAGVIAP